VEISVSDTGDGITQEFLPYVFDRFRQGRGGTTRAHGGRGLGLASGRHHVELHGGTVEVESAGEGTGACFTVKLPVRAVAPTFAAEPSAAECDGPESDAAAIRLDGVRVLVVDDHEDARELVRVALESFGATTVTAGSASQAIAAISLHRPDVCVSDVGMPDVDGYELLRRIRALEDPVAARVPALALTAYARDVERERALEAGFENHLSKPVDPRELARAVAALAGSPGTSSERT
jgi:CheY-like chemotaxis protein